MELGGGCISSSVGGVMLTLSQGTVGLCLRKGLRVPDQKQADQGPFVLFKKFKKFPVFFMFVI